VERAIDELKRVREALQLEKVHLFGSSWGGMLAMSYVLEARPTGIVSLNLSSSPASSAAWIEYSHHLRAALPEEVRIVIDSHEARSHFACPEFVGAMAIYYKRHLCRLEPWPEGLEDAFDGLGVEVYETMWGPTEFGPCTGVLKDYDVLSRLGEVEMPTLLTIGRHDECPLDLYEEMGRLLPHSELGGFGEKPNQIGEVARQYRHAEQERDDDDPRKGIENPSLGLPGIYVRMPGQSSKLS